MSKAQTTKTETEIKADPKVGDLFKTGRRTAIVTQVTDEKIVYGLLKANGTLPQARSSMWRV